MLDIKPLGDTLGAEYTKPSAEKLAEFEAALGEGTGLEYLTKDRALTLDTIKHFRLGYDAERKAIAIPIFKEGELINFKYRFIDPDHKPKYDSEKGAETWVYNDEGFKYAKKHNRVLVVEGEFDLMSAYQAGIRNVISPASGKNSYAPWIDKLDNILEVYIAYDNDQGGRETAREMAERIGIEKSFEVKYPEGTKDANDYLKYRSSEDFKTLIKESRPYYTYKYKGVRDIISDIRNKKDDSVKIPFIPKVEIEKDWLIVISGKTNVGKTSYALNLADDLADKGHPVLIMPFERGNESVGKRFLQVKFNKSMQELRDTQDYEWDSMIEKCVDTPIYFSTPKKEDVKDTIITSRRLFNTKFVIVDHLDYLVRNSANKEGEIGDTLRDLKRIAEEHGICMLVITHIRKIEHAGSLLSNKTPGYEDLKGSSSLYQDPECVVMLSSKEEGKVFVDIVKNKGEMSNQTFEFNSQTGKLTEDLFDSI